MGSGEGWDGNQNYVEASGKGRKEGSEEAEGKEEVGRAMSGHEHYPAPPQHNFCSLTSYEKNNRDKENADGV